MRASRSRRSGYRGVVPPIARIGRNVEIFDRLRRWAYAAVSDWRMAARYSGGVYDGWCGAVADREPDCR